MFYERRSWASAFDLQAMSRVLGFGVFICCCDEWDNQVLEGCEELDMLLVLSFHSFPLCCVTAIHI
jgi:hypothetical protein